ncbi:glycosyltransferase family 4 protein [Pseudomonas sp. JH-2]|uniref:glycosyltransferase family 4 protein n=1 Tax=unclassified Pseudomonas TaxID=196821 RepID=UPI000D6F8C31|nr:MULTISPECIES: glycosyltransferase family 4 protein [unclassified Pseudomonas]MED5610386.1 glycosyltransferase family 4 protein [Pseudomonas sp. JH-2]PWU29983.1 glycosyl transferase [Pseudomonas sp. RW407]
MSVRLKKLLAWLAWHAYRWMFALLRCCLNERQLQQFVVSCRRLKYRYFPEAAPIQGAAAAALPHWIVEELRELSHIEPALYPSDELLGRFRSWQPGEDPHAAALYRELLADFVDSRPQVIFLIPHMMRGGADLGTLHHVHLCVEQGLRVTVVITRDVLSPWINRLPAAARVVEFGRLTRHAGDEDRELVLLRLLLQSPASTLHLINSLLGWQLFERFGKPLVSSGKRLFASVYCDDVDRNGVRCGYATEFLPKAWMHLAGVFTDNQHFLELIQRRDGLPRERLHALYFPFIGEIVSAPGVGRKVLWAGRLAAQKRPELLYEIARAMPEVGFDVHGEADPAYDSNVLQRLKALPNVSLVGRFDSFAAIAQAGDYGVFLYTSAYDGLPNVLLEATAAGLPIVAPTVGGIAELVEEDSGYPLDAAAGPLAFVEMIRRVLEDPQRAERKVTNAQARMRGRHVWATFTREVAAVPGYLPTCAAPQLVE